MTDRYEKRTEHAPPERDIFTEVMDHAKAGDLVPSTWQRHLVFEGGHDADSWDTSHLTPAQRRQIADAMTAAWKEWVDG